MDLREAEKNPWGLDGKKFEHRKVNNSKANSATPLLSSSSSWFQDEERFGKEVEP